MGDGGRPATVRGMRAEGWGRATFVAQWVLAVLLPAFVVVGRGLVGAELGWMAVIGLVVYLLPTILLLLIPPLLTLFDAAAGRPRTVRLPYAVCTWLQWVALLVAGLTIPDSGDAGHLRSALSRWTGLSYEVSEAIFYVAFGLLVLAWLAALVTAIAAMVSSRRVSTPAA